LSIDAHASAIRFSQPCMVMLPHECGIAEPVEGVADHQEPAFPIG
jgi:hypothetical protein